VARISAQIRVKGDGFERESWVSQVVIDRGSRNRGVDGSGTMRWMDVSSGGSKGEKKSGLVRFIKGTY
jgi:hypothetical protein